MAKMGVSKKVGAPNRFEVKGKKHIPANLGQWEPLDWGRLRIHFAFYQ